jgi:hypothetical protein
VPEVVNDCQEPWLVAKAATPPAVNPAVVYGVATYAYAVTVYEVFGMPPVTVWLAVPDWPSRMVLVP